MFLMVVDSFTGIEVLSLLILFQYDKPTNEIHLYMTNIIENNYYTDPYRDRVR